MSSGLAIAILGVWMICQITRGDALDRLGVRAWIEGNGNPAAFTTKPYTGGANSKSGSGDDEGGEETEPAEPPAEAPEIVPEIPA